MGKGALTANDPRLRMHSLGYVSDEAKKFLVYSAVDAVIHPAPVDNLPNVLVEALACGTPAIGLPVGGVPEIIRPGGSGWLAAEANAASLANAVSQALGDLANGCNLRETCRKQAEAHFSSKVQAQRYEALFREQLQKNRRIAG
jgi:glycosyltransferase involved in cell wall biosynthesis